MTTPEQNHENLLHYKFTPSSAAIASVLILALVGLGERVLYDVARWITGGSSVNYFNDLRVIVAHGVIIIALLIISLVMNLTLGEKKRKYALAVIPYFVLSIVLALQLALQVTVYFAEHHTKLQLYVVMVILIAVCTAAIYYIQKKFITNQ